MFKKKKDQDAVAAEKPQPKPKAKKGKSRSSGGGMKNFFLMHSEKLVLGIVGLVSAFLIFNGITVKRFPQDKTPSQLTQISTQAETAVKADHWAAIETQPERKFETSFASMVEKSSRANDPNVYPLPVWDAKPESGGQKRLDPKLLPPVEIEVQTVYGSLATWTTKTRELEARRPPYEDPLLKLKNAPSLNKNKPGPQGAAGTMGYGASGSGSMGEEGSGSGMMGLGSGMTGAAGTEPIRFLLPKYDLGFGGTSRMAGGSMGMGMGMEGEGSSGSGMMMAGPSGGKGGGGAMGAPGGGMGMPSGGMQGGSMGGMNGMNNEALIEVASAVMFNAVKALVPYDEQIREYNDALEKSANHDPRRDFPLYTGFEVQRVSIAQGNPGREIKEEEWEVLDHTKLRITPDNRDKYWLGPMQEIVNGLYTHPKLTMSIPPVLVHDYRKFAKHSKTPTIYDFVPMAGQKRPQDPEENGDFIKTDDGQGGLGGGMGSGMGMGMGYEGSGSGMGMGMGYEGSGSGMGMGYEGSGSGMGMGYEGSGSGMGMGYEGSGSGMGMGYEGSGSGMMGMGMGMGASMPKTKYKLVRFYDFDVKPGVTYRYRVRVLVEDPNYSKFFRTPSMHTLDQEALRRVQDLEVIDKKVNDKIIAEDYDKNMRPKDRRDPRTNKRIFARELQKSSTRKSDWSDISRAVRVPAPVSIAIGKLATETSPKMQVATAAFKTIDGVGVDVYRTDSIVRGEIISGSKDSGKFGPPIIHPLNKKVLCLEPKTFDFRANLVLDVRMPEKLSFHTAGRDPMEGAAEVAMVDPDTGDVRISHEFADFDSFRMFSFAEEVEAAAKSNRNSGPGGAPGASGSGSMGTEGSGGGKAGKGGK